MPNIQRPITFLNQIIDQDLGRRPQHGQNQTIIRMLSNSLLDDLQLAVGIARRTDNPLDGSSPVKEVIAHTRARSQALYDQEILVLPYLL